MRTRLRYVDSLGDSIAVSEAVSDVRPPVIPSFLKDVELIAPVGAVFGRPQTPIAIARETLRVSETERQYLRTSEAMSMETSLPKCERRS